MGRSLTRLARLSGDIAPNLSSVPASAARGQLATVAVGSTTIDTRSYDVGGRMTAGSYNNGVSESRTYNNDNTLTGISYSGAPIGDRPFWSTRRKWVPEGEQLMMCNVSKTEWAENDSQRPETLPIIGESEVFWSGLSPQERKRLLDDCECQALESCEKSGQSFSRNWQHHA